MKKFRWDKRYLYVGVTAFLVIISSIVFYMALEYLPLIRRTLGIIWGVLTPIVWGFVISYLLLPMCRTFENKIFTPLARKHIKKEGRRRGVSRALSIVLSDIVALALIFALLSLVLPQIYVSIQSIVTNMGDYTMTAIGWMEKWLKNFPEVEEFLISAFDTITSYLADWAKNSLLPQMNDLVTTLSSGVYAVVYSFIKWIINFFIGFVVSIYVLYNRETFSGQSKKTLYSIFSKSHVDSFLAALDFADTAFSKFFVGKLLDSLIIFVLCFISCKIFKFPYEMLISVIIGVTNIIPFFGPFIGAIPSALIVLLVSPSKFFAFILFVLVLQQVDGNIIGPKILGSTTGLNGFWVMFAILVGGGLFGFLGMICGVPLFTVIYAGVKTVVGRRLEERGMPPETEAYKGKGVFSGEIKTPPSQDEGADEEEAVSGSENENGSSHED